MAQLTAPGWLLNEQQGPPATEVLGPWHVVSLLGCLSSLLGPGATSEESVLSLPPTPRNDPLCPHPAARTGSRSQLAEFVKCGEGGGRGGQISWRRSHLALS